MWDFRKQTLERFTYKSYKSRFKLTNQDSSQIIRRFFTMFRLQAKFLAGRQFQTRPFLRALASYSSQNSYVNEIKDTMVNQHVAKVKQEKAPLEDTALKIAFFSNKHNSMSQRLCLELERRNHQVKVFEINNSSEMTEIANTQQADIIVAPFLTKTVPEDVYNNLDVPCIIVHPGIEGDRGRHSLDWALKKKQSEWGVTLLQAAEEMDAGDIWSTSNFQLNRKDINTLTKSSLYTNEVTEAAVRCLLDTVERFNKKLSPRPLNYDDSNVKGKLMEPLKKADRTVDWKLPADEVACQVRMSDSSPGAIATLLLKENGKTLNEKYRVFGAHLEQANVLTSERYEPGQIVAQRHGAVLVKCGEGALWLSHLKKNKLKLPAMSWLKNYGVTIPSLPEPNVELFNQTHPSTFQEIWTKQTPEGVCFVHFNFYNGAMNTDQCQRLSNALRRIAQDEKAKIVVLMGGHNFFSNGIHLNCIESAPNPAIESLHNITAINDVVKDVFSMQDKITVSAVQGNAGAGGVMMALASDLVLSRDGVVINPHYTNMKLFGSEYHTFFLERKLGREKMEELTSGSRGMLSSEAVDIGLFDGVMGSNVEEFQTELEEFASQVATHPALGEMLERKSRMHEMAWYEQAEHCRQNEIKNMMKNFQSGEYETARRNFVLH